MSPRLRNLLMTSTALLALGAALVTLGAVPGGAQPTGPSVVGGSATVSGAGTSAVIVNQSSNRAIINWNTFNVSTGGSATFNQPNSSAITLNRVTGGLGPSVIDGTVTANGRVFIINRDGMLFGRNAVINTAGFLASTNDIRNDDFMAGRMNFNIPGRPDASIVNLGTITASSHGFAALVAPGVRNAGTITATLGTVAVASGNSFTLDMYGDKLIQLAVGDEIAGKVIDVSTGKPLSSLVSNEGRISANGGRVELTAAAARHVVDSVINNRGVIEANSIGTRNGMIVLGGATAPSKTAGLPKQTIKVSGTISATGKDKGSKGGTIQITGEDIQFAAAMLDVSGHSGGGKILVGGDYGGGRPIPGVVNNQSAVLENIATPTATTVTVDSATTFNASATANGNGGKVILWSDTMTTFAGTIFARGGEQGGNGGFVEVSGKQQLAYAGMVDTRAPNGQAGALLLDPDNFNIDAAAASTIMANLATTPVVILTSAAGTGGSGDITVNAPITWSSINDLTLSAYRNVVVNAAITSTGLAPVTLRADNTGTGVGTVSFAAGATVSTLGAVSIFYNPTSYASPTDYSANVPQTHQAYMLVNSAQNLQDIETNLGGTYALGRDINATGFGFVPLSTFDGVLDGQNRTISNLTTTGESPFSAVDGEIRNLNLVNVNVTATGNGQAIGGLVGILSGGTISNVTVSGTVNGGAFRDITAGGLVGHNQNGEIINSHAAVNVTIGTSSDTCNIEVCTFRRSAHAGGLVGINDGSIWDSSASGNVQGGGGTIIGGLVGSNGTTDNSEVPVQPWISSSYATGKVSSVVGNNESYAAHAGGLVGANWGAIETSYATGDVSSSGNVRTASVGGLVGQLMGQGTIWSTYASGNVTIANTYAGDWGSPVGGLVGSNQTGTWISDSYALGNVTVSGLAANYTISAGGFIGTNAGSISNAYSTGSIKADAGNAATLVAGGFIGNQIGDATVTNGYWDTGTSQRTNAVGTGSSDGITGLTTAQARSMASYAGFDFSGSEGSWFIIDGQTRPFLRSEWSNVIRNTHQLQLIAMAPGGNYVLANNIDFTGQFNESGMWGARGFASIGNQSQPFNGTLEGDGHTISNAIITGSGQQNHIGLFGSIGAGGIVRNLTLSAFQVSANTIPYLEDSIQLVGTLAGSNTGTISNVIVLNSTVDGHNLPGVIAGGLVGRNGGFGNPGVGGTITGASVSAIVTVGSGCVGDCYGGMNFAGGLVGFNTAGSTITSSSAAGSVSGAAYSFIGGLVGQNDGSITNSSASAMVASTANGALFSNAAGGLVGYNTGSISGSRATGNASGVGSSEGFLAAIVGGLVGLNEETGQITNSSAGGTVIGFNVVQLGGLVGGNFGTITNSSATGDVTGDGRGSIGGLVGNNFFGATVTGSSASGTVGGSGSLNAGGLIGDNSGTISGSQATGNVGVRNTSPTDVVAGGFVGANDGDITNSHATGHVTTINGDVTGGGFSGFNLGSIANSYATGNVTANGATLAMLGGFTGGNVGTITNAHATGSVTTNAPFAIAGGFVGLNIGTIDLSFANGNVSAGNDSFVGGFVGFNFGGINQAFASGAVTGGANSFVGGFAGANLGIDVSGQFGDNAAASGFGNVGSITQSYALGPVTGGNAAIAASFAALNYGTLGQVYGVGRVQGGTGSTLGGLIAVNTPSIVIPDFGLGSFGSNLPTGTATSSFWDMQTTAMLTSAGGVGMNTSVLSGGLPPGFDPQVWNQPSYPFLVNLVPNTQNTTPLPPIIPPVGVSNDPPPFIQPPDQQINANPLTPLAPPSDLMPNVVQFVQQQQQQQQQQGQQGADRTVTGSVNDPIRLDVGENRYFYIPPPGETRIVTNEVVLQMPCDVPADALNAILAQNSLTVLGTQCFQQSGQAAYRMQHASSETVANVIRALAEHQVIAAAQANYLYALTETKVQSATSQQGDPGQYVPAKLRLQALHRVVRGNGVPIAVIDSEIDGAHPDLSGTIANRYDATGVEDSPHAHGTGMAGAIVSHQRLLGVAPGARIVAIRAFSTRSTNPESTTYNILRGIDWAADNNVRIINMSFAGPRDPSLERALKAAYDKGVVLVAAAGNAGPRAPALYPAADPHVIAVTATDIDDQLFSGANRGNHVAIAAPGVDVLVPAPAGEYQVTTGTSVATAHISGVIALMLERNPKLAPADVRRILAGSAKRLGPLNMFGAGLVDPMRAIEMATPRSAAVPVWPATTTAAAAR